MNKHLKALIIFVLCFVALFLVLRLTYNLPKELENINILDQLDGAFDGFEESRNRQTPDYDFSESLKLLEGMWDNNND